MAKVHLDSFGDHLASGMAWPISVSAIADALARRPEPEIWFKAYRTDDVKYWAQNPRHPGDDPVVSILRLSYEESDVRRKVDFQKRASGEKAAWFGMDDPPLVSGHLDSVPAALMRDAKLTRARSAAALADTLAVFPKTGITQRDWKIDLVLEAAAFVLSVRMYHRDVRDWEFIRESRVPLAE